MISKLEETLALHMRAAGLQPVREYRLFAEMVGSGPGLRKRLTDAGLKNCRFDFAFIAEKLLVEVEGGTWTGGRHVTGTGFEADCTKYNQALLCGWRVLRFTSTAVKSGVALQSIEAALAVKWTQTWSVTA